MMAVAHMCAAIVLSADVKADIPSPDGKTVVSVIEREDQVYYQVEHDGKRFVHSSRLGLRTNAFDFSLLEFVTSDFERIQGTYEMDRSKASEMSYDVTKAVLTFKNPKDKTIQIEFRVENNDVAFRYFIPKEGETGSVRILEEMTEFSLPYLLVDALWDQNLGYEGIEELAAYAKSKNVDLFLWYSSSGWWNDIVQGPYNVMSNPILRKRDMRWMKEIGVKGILEKLGVEDAPVRLIDGGNEPVESAVKASRKVSVAMNDAAILVIG